MPEAIVARILRLPGYGAVPACVRRGAGHGNLLGAADGAASLLLLPALRDQHPGDGRGPDGAPGPGSPLGSVAGLTGG